MSLRLQDTTSGTIKAQRHHSEILKILARFEHEMRFAKDTISDVIKALCCLEPKFLWCDVIKEFS